MLFGDLSQQDGFASAGAREQDIDLALSRFTMSNNKSGSSRLAASPWTPITFRPITFMASSICSCFRPVMKT